MEWFHYTMQWIVPVSTTFARAVFYNGNVEATTMQDRYGRTPLH
jgi:hypothetical protein